MVLNVILDSSMSDTLNILPAKSKHPLIASPTSSESSEESGISSLDSDDLKVRQRS